MLTGKSIIGATIGLILLMLMVGTVQAKGNIDRGGDMTFDCIECHKMDGKGDFETPSIAGLDEAYILKRLKAFKRGQRESMDDMMHMYTQDWTDQDLQDLAAYWASKKK